MASLRAIIALFGKDLEDAARSQTLLVMLLGPVVLSVLMARSLGAADIRRPLLAVYDPGSSGLVRVLEASELIRIERVSSWSQGRELVERGRAPASLGVPAGFDGSLEQDLFPRLDLAVDESYRGQVAVIREAIRSALREQVGQEIPADIRVDKVREFTGAPRKTLLPIWVVFTTLGALMVTASTLVEEKEKKTLSAILAAPVELWEVLAGKLLSGFFLAALASVLVLALNQGFTRSWLSELALIALGCLAFAGLGTLVGLSVQSQATANAVLSGLYLVLFVPVALADVSQVMFQAARWMPTYYLQSALSQSILGGAGFSEVSRPLLILAVSTLLAFGASLWQLKRYRLAD
ncbi:MAG: hypothetical protein AMXMBFR33_05400 [Candidatus Xenobia bacterium]